MRLPAETEAWHGINWGLVEGLIRWQLQAGYPIGSVNVRIGTGKGYARLAMTLRFGESARIAYESGKLERYELKRFPPHQTL